MVQAMSATLQPLMERIERLESASAAAKLAVSLPLVPVSTSGSSGGLPAPVSVALAFPAPTVMVNALCVPDRLRDRIIRGEFVKFDELLPECIGTKGEQITQISIKSGRAIQLLHKSASSVPHHHIHDVSTWLEAVTVYMHIRVAQLIHPLLSYQATILEANVNYHTTAWRSYDNKFRRAMVNLPDLYRFNCIDSHLWQSCFASRGRPACTQCQIIHPIPTPQCPFRGGLSLYPGQSGRRDVFSPAFQGKQICRNFNRNACHSKLCHHAHICLRCNGKHSEENGSKSSTGQ